jgi:D-3-phosphoglycerate dehydrogenase / 2-oxoglutarate reductase
VLPSPGKLNIAVLSAIWPAAIEQLQRRFPVQVALEPALAKGALPTADVAIIRSGVRLDRHALDMSPRLMLIVRAGSGLDGIDIEAARQRNIRIISAPLSAESVAEHTLALMLALSRQIIKHDAALRAGRWEKHSSHARDLFGRHLGLLGFGRIGRRTAELGQAFGMRISACDRSCEKPEKQAAAERLGVEFVSLETLFQTAEVVTIQTPLNHQTRKLVDRRLLSMLRPDAILIHVGRGGTVDEAALYEALRDGTLAGAALDVFEREPPGAHPLLELSNFLGTPHVAAQTVDAQARVGAAVVRIIEAFAAGGDWQAQGVLVV